MLNINERENKCPSKLQYTRESFSRNLEYLRASMEKLHEIQNVLQRVRYLLTN